METMVAVLAVAMLVVVGVLGWLVREALLQRRALSAVSTRATRAHRRIAALGVQVQHVERRVTGVELDLGELLVDGDELRDRIGQVERISEGQGVWLSKLQDWLGRIDSRRRPAGLPGTAATEVVRKVGGGRTMRWDEVRVGAKG
ncbi:hypothetical protein [Chitinimonas lacunae]|uniref:DUF2746 domain-containing protein n=1 Tax=Chitinimonas lacunae TaxID=1963018 RepID=A0ABV8MUL1_9NEIS